MASLVACPGCSVHVAILERNCPHCGASLRRSDGTIPQTAAALLMGLSLGGCEDNSIPVYGVAAATSTGASSSGGGCQELPGSPAPPNDPLPSLADAQAA